MTLFDGTRRGFLHFGIAAMACATATPALAAVRSPKGSKSLAFHNLHTDERLRVTYWREGKYDQAAHARINHILRDYRTGDVSPIDLRLMDLLYDLQRRSGEHGPIEVISGFRSRATNLMLAKYTDGVARHSYHTKGMAIDIRMPGLSLPKLYHSALAMRRGGVGYYPSSDFVHVDVGPARTW